MSGVPDCLVRIIVVGKGADWLGHAAIIGPRRIVTVSHTLEHQVGPIVVMDWERGFKWRGKKRQVVEGVATNDLPDGAAVIDLTPPADKSWWNYPEHCIAPVLAESEGWNATDADRAAWLLTARGLQHYPGQTRLGDSGAPCFDREMRVVGLRSHGGGPGNMGAFLPIRQREDGSIVTWRMPLDGIEDSGKMSRVRGDR